MEYISIDIGNGYVKAVNLEGDTLHFPTVLKENRDKNILGEAKSNYKIEVNGKSYNFVAKTHRLAYGMKATYFPLDFRIE